MENSQIRFREWETERKTMVIGAREDYDDSVNFRFAHEEGGERILMQFTGLKDTNGVDIYEGDIVKLHVVILSPDDKVGEVKYSPAYGYSIYFASNRMARQEYWATGGKHTIEVIGNIHENADLLEG